MLSLRPPTVWFNETSGSNLFTIHRLRANRDGDPVRVVCTHRNQHSALLQAADVAQVEPDGLPAEDYAAWALEFADRHGVDFFVPLRELAAVVGRAADFSAAGVALLVATLDHFDEVDNKAKCYEMCAALDIPVPRFIVADDHDSYGAAFELLRGEGLRVCHKPVRDIGGAGFRRVSDAARGSADLYRPPGVDIALEDVLRLLEHAGRVQPPLMLCEYVSEPQYSVDCLAWEGRLLGAVARIKHSPEVREIVERPDLVVYIRRLAAHLRLSGVFNVQFRGQPHPRLMELNPRPSGGLHQSVAVEYLWEAIYMSLGGKPRPLPPEHPRFVAALAAAFPFEGPEVRRPSR